MDKQTFEVGQPVWFFIPYGSASLVEGKITTVGRKYLTINERYRFHIDTLIEADGNGSRMRMYTSKEVYLAEREHEQNVSAIAKFFRNLSTQQAVTLEQTRQIMKILNIEE